MKTIEIINTIPQQLPVQYDLLQQLAELRKVANKLGLYDAADYLKTVLNIQYGKETKNNSIIF